MKRPISYRILKSRLWLPVLAGGVALQFNLSSCDPEVRSAVLTGIQSTLTGMISALLNAFFLALQEAGTSTSQPVVQAAETVSRWLA